MPRSPARTCAWGWALFGLFCLLFGGTVASRCLPLALMPARLSVKPTPRSAALSIYARWAESGPELGGGRPGLARCQGPLRHGRHPHDVRLGRVRRPRPDPVGRGGRGARAGRLGERRQDEPARVRLRRHVAEPALRRRAEPALPGPDRRAARRAARPPRSCSAKRTARSAPTRAARFASQPPAAASRGFKPTYGLVPIDGVFPLAPCFDHAGPMARDVAGCIELMHGLVPGFSVDEVSLDELSLAVAWGDVPVRGDADRVPDRGGRRAGVHARGRRRPPRALRGARGAVRREHPRQDRAVPRRHRRRVRRGGSRARGACGARRSRRSSGHDLLVTPTLSAPCLPPTSSRSRSARP